MAKISPLWTSTSRKESMDLLRVVWKSSGPAERDAIENELLSGPPTALLDALDPSEREESADRRLFDRLTVLKRSEVPLSPRLREKLSALHEKYPRWLVQEGERAHFVSWMEVRTGPDSDWSSEDLRELGQRQLIDLVESARDGRENLLESFRQLAINEPSKVISLLEELSTQDNGGRADTWQHALRGLRNTNETGLVSRELIPLLAGAPMHLFLTSEFTDAAAELLEVISRSIEDEASASYWKLFDRTLEGAARNEGNETEELEPFGEPVDWVMLALNCSMGNLATAFLNNLFARRLKVGQGVPLELLPRLDRLMRSHNRRHLPARVIAASRISYLMAVDQEWTSRVIVPGFGFDDEEEAIALWQGYAWQPRIDPVLWSALRPTFLQVFSPDRLERLGHYRRSMAQLFMLVGIEFGPEEVSRDFAQDAVRSMTPEMRGDAAHWLATYLDESSSAEHGGKSSVDTLWTKKVEPWLAKIWPADPNMRTQMSAQQFAMAAIATRKAFPRAVEFVRQFLQPTAGFMVVRELEQSPHPDSHPAETLTLIDAVLDPASVRMHRGELPAVLDRITRARPAVRQSHTFRRWSQIIRAVR